MGIDNTSESAFVLSDERYEELRSLAVRNELVDVPTHELRAFAERVAKEPTGIPEIDQVPTMVEDREIKGVKTESSEGLRRALLADVGTLERLGGPVTPHIN